jgi:hypothetical protein
MTLFHVSLGAFLCQFLPNVNAALGISQNIGILSIFCHQLLITLSQNGDNSNINEFYFFATLSKNK